MVKFYAYFILARKFPDLSFSWKFKTSSPAPPNYSLSLYILGIYALRVTRISPCGSRFTLFAASAERKSIFWVEKSTGEWLSWEISCFSEFSNFFDFSRFWDVLAMNFDSLAWFPARDRFQIDRAWIFKLIQIFVFICSSCVALTINPTASKMVPIPRH